MSIDFHAALEKLIIEGNRVGRFIFDDHERAMAIREAFQEFRRDGEYLMGSYEQEFLFTWSFCSEFCSTESVVGGQCMAGHCFNEDMYSMCMASALPNRERRISEILHGIVVYEDALHAMTDGGITREGIRRLVAGVLGHERRHAFQSRRLVKFATNARMYALANDMQGYTDILCEQDADMAALQFVREIARYSEE